MDDSQQQYGQPQQFYPPQNQQFYPPQQQQQQQQYYPPQQQQQYYAPQQPAMTDDKSHVYVAPAAGVGGAQAFDNLIPKKEERFKATQYKDLWATILWVICLIGLAVISYFGISRLRNLTPPTSGNGSGSIEFKLSDGDIGISVASTVVTGFVLSLLYFLAMQKFAGTLIKITLVLAIVFNFIVAGLFFYLKQYVPAIVWLLFGAIYAWCYWSWRHRIPFAKFMLKTVTSITKQYPSLIVVGIAGLIVQFAFVAWWLFTLIGLLKLSNEKQLSSGATYALWVYLIFIFYWTSQVIANAVHIATAGVNYINVAFWYLLL